MPPAYYIAMEYVAGLDVASLLKRSRRRSEILPVELCLYVVAEIAKGLDHAHRRRDEQMRPLGIVHRDVSPQNVLLSWEGEVKVTDFGIAKARGVVEDPLDGTQIMGKFAYMSPEQASGRAVDARSDIFSLGAMLYEMLAGVNPFSAATPFETLRRVQAAEYPPIEVLREDVPADLVAIVRRALAKSPDDRIENSSRFFEDVLGYMYSSGTRFTANGLTEYLAKHRESDASDHKSREVLRSLEPIGEEYDRTPVEVPSPVSGRVEPPSSGTPVIAGSSFLGARREVTALVLTFAERDWTFPEHLRARVKDTLARYGARVLDEEPLQIVSLFGLGEMDGQETVTAIRCALVLLRQLSVGTALPSAGVHVGWVLVQPSSDPAMDARLTSLVSEAQALARASEHRCAVSAAAAGIVRRAFSLEPMAGVTRCGVAAGAMLVEDLRPPDLMMGRFVGRTTQLRRVGEVLALVTRRQLRVVVVQGEQGIGKTRFLHEIRRRIRKGDYDVGFYRATCPPRGKESPLSGLTAMLEVLCGVREGDPLERVMGVEPRLRALGLPDEERHAVLGQLGAKRSGQTGPNLPPLRAAFARMVQHLCEDRLHVFVWDDAHALDDDTLDILHGAVIRLYSVRAVFLAAMRSPSQHKLFRHACCESIVLDELNEADTTKLVAGRAALREVPNELLAFCRSRAGGHPLFVEELVKDLIETGSMTVKERRVHTLKLVGDVAVPRSLRALLAARVARLEDDPRAALFAVAILGDSVDTTILATMLGVSLQTAERTIAVLEERSFLRRTGPSSAALASPMLRESVLESLPTDTKHELHAAAAAAYETVYGPAIECKAHDVAQHLRETGDRDRAAEFYALSGKVRLRSGQLEFAARDLMRAFDIVDLSHRNAAELCAWLENLHTALRSVRAAPALPSVVERVVRRFDTDGDPTLRVVARIHGAGMLGATHQFELADEYINEALVLAENSASLQRSALLAGAEIDFKRGQFRRSIERYNQATSQDALGELQEQEAYRLALGLAHTLAARGDRHAALAHLERASELTDPADPAGAVEREKVVGIVHYFTGDFRSAVDAFARGIDLARASGLSYEEALALHNMGDALVWLGDFARAHVAFRESLAVCEEYGYERLGPHDRMYLAFLDAEQGIGDATVTLRNLIAEAEAHGFIWDVLDGRHLLGTSAFRRGDMSTARNELEIVRDMARDNHNLLLEQSAVEMLVQIQVSTLERSVVTSRSPEIIGPDTGGQHQEENRADPGAGSAE